MTQESTGNSANPAVARCSAIWRRVYAEQTENGETSGAAAFMADRAYCNAMPPLSGQQNIGDFIACVAHGILIDAISANNAAKLL